MADRFLCLPVLYCEMCGDEMVMSLPVVLSCASCRRRAARARRRVILRDRPGHARRPKGGPVAYVEERGL